MTKKIFYNIKNKCENITENLKNNSDRYKFIIKPFWIITIIYIIAISTIIRADFNYVDDLGRVAEGYRGWSNFSRYLSSLFSIFIHTGFYLTDISPIPQLLAVCILAISSVMVLYVYKNEKKFSAWDIIAIIPLGLSPYFLECLSFKYDAPYMALSVFASVLPLLFINKKSIIYSIVTILCTLGMCMTYQASSGIFIMLVLLLFLKKWNEGECFKKSFKFLMISSISYVVGLLVFKLFILNPVENYISTSMLPLNNLIPGTLKNLYKYFAIIKSDFKKEWIVLIALMFMSFIYIFVCNSKRKKHIAFLASVLVLGLMAILSFGVYSILEEPIFRPRSMYGFCIFISLIGVAISTTKKAYLSKIIVTILSWTFIVFAFTYGNALKIQDEYMKFRVNLVVEDLNDIEIFVTDNIKNVQIKGTIGKTPILENMPQDYELLNRLVPIQFGGTYWEGYYFYNYLDLKNVVQDYSKDLTTYNLPVLKDTMYHRIKGNDENILIELK